MRYHLLAAWIVRFYSLFLPFAYKVDGLRNLPHIAVTYLSALRLVHCPVRIIYIGNIDNKE